MIPPRWHRELIVPDLGPCELWEGAITSAGYALMRIPGGVGYVHRLRYEEEVGPIEDGLELDHLCRVTACVRVEHLEPVTHAENMRRGGSTKLTPAIVAAIRAASGSQREIADRFGINRAHVSRIRNGQSWASEKAA